jgi:hypothetical protein
MVSSLPRSKVSPPLGETISMRGEEGEPTVIYRALTTKFRFFTFPAAVPVRSSGSR